MKKISRLFGFQRKKEADTVFSNNNQEVFVISYPKSGSTWLRVMLGKYVQLLISRDESLPLPLFDSREVLDRRIPIIQFNHGALEWTSQTSDDLTLDNVVQPYCQYPVILLVRSIPDVLVSLYWQEKTQVTPPYQGEISDYIRHPVYGVDKAVQFYSLWDEGRSAVPQIILMRYEDIRFNPAKEFKRLLEFTNIPINEQYVTQSIEFSNFNNMRKMEENNKEKRNLVYPSSGLPIFATGDVQKNREAFHVRKGQVGGFEEYLSEGDIQYLRKQMQDKIPQWYRYPDGFWKNDDKK